MITSCKTVVCYHTQDSEGDTGEKRTFTTLQVVHMSLFYSHRNLPSLAPGNCSSLSIILSFKEYYITGIIECVTLWNWLFFPLSITLWRSIQVVDQVVYQWFIPFYYWAIRLTTGGVTTHLLKSIWVGAVPNKVAVNSHPQVFTWTSVFISWGKCLGV